MEQRHATFIDNLNNFGLSIVVAVSGFFIYIFAKFGKWIADNLCQSIMDKYTNSVRSEAKQIVEENLEKLEKKIDEKIIDIKNDIKDINNNLKTEKIRRHDAIAKNEGVLNSALDLIERLDKKLNEKTIINIPTNKHNSESMS